MAEPRISRRVVLRGQVQGVGFRDFILGEAEQRGLSGWVRNRKDGSVEFKVEGPASAVRALIEASLHGPPAARILKVEQTNATIEGARGFGRWPTV